jgi:hypothetical protein
MDASNWIGSQNPNRDVCRVCLSLICGWLRECWGTPDSFAKVRKFFELFGDIETCKIGEFRGWLTSNPIAVYRALGITSENTLNVRFSELSRERAKFVKLSKEINSKHT